MSFGGSWLIGPLASLMGIRAGMKVSVLNAPTGFLEALNPMPEGCELMDQARTGIDCTIFFTAKKLEVIERLPKFTQGMSVMGGIWVCFPTVPDLPTAPSEDFVRLAALELGLVDNKKVMLGPEWTALRLVWKPRGPRLEKPQVTA